MNSNTCYVLYPPQIENLLRVHLHYNEFKFNLISQDNKIEKVPDICDNQMAE